MFASKQSLNKSCLWIATLVLAGCASAPPQAPEAAPAIVSLQEYVQQASKAAADGSREKARETYRVAAKAYPASHVPWTKLAEDYFEAADYGNAILAAQEVLQRDANDNVAASLLAVSGLRVSASALQLLRTQKNLATGTRSEAETVARTLREVLGETVLVPQPVTTHSAATASPPSTKPTTRVRAPAATRAQPAPVKKASADKPAESSNPFDKLK